MVGVDRRRRAPAIMPEAVIERVDALAGQRQRSRFVTKAIEEKLADRRLTAALAEMDGALADAMIPGWEAPHAAAQRVRSLRRGGEVPAPPAGTSAA